MNPEVITEEERERRERLKKRIKDDFEDDVLFKLLEDRGWTDSIFGENLLSIRPGEFYSTERVCDLLSIGKQQDIRNAMRTLQYYIRPDESTRPHRYDFKSIVRIRMIFLLKQEFTLPMLDKFLNSPMKGNEAAVPVPSGFVYRTLDEMNEKIDLLAQMMKQVTETVQIQKQIASVQDEERTRAIQQFTEIMQNQSQLVSEHLAQSARLISLQASEDPEAVRAKEMDARLTRIKLENRLRQRALEEWGKLSVSERFVKTGLFSKGEDLTKRDAFIAKYIAEYVEEEIKKDFGF